MKRRVNTDTLLALQVEHDDFYSGQYWCVLTFHGENVSYTQDRRQGAVQSCHRSHSPMCQRKPHSQKPVLLFFPLVNSEREKKGRREGGTKEERRETERKGWCKQQQSTRKCLLNVKDFCLILRKCSVLSVAA